MAWPLTPLQSFTDDAGPPVTALTLNSVQSGINNILLGTFSTKGMIIDGTGGAVVAPTAGTLTVASGVTITAGDLTASASNIKGKRLRSNGTAHVVGDFVLSPGWGSTANVSGVSGDDQMGTVTIVPGGAAIAANPTITLSWKDGTWTTTPRGMAFIASVTTSPFASVSTGALANSVVFTYNSTPVAGDTIVIAYFILGT